MYENVPRHGSLEKFSYIGFNKKNQINWKYSNEEYDAIMLFEKCITCICKPSTIHIYVQICIFLRTGFINAHYIGVIMTTMASQITSLTVVYSIVYSDADQRKPVTGKFSSQMAGNAENVSIWWRYHDLPANSRNEYLIHRFRLTVIFYVGMFMVQLKYNLLYLPCECFVFCWK